MFGMSLNIASTRSSSKSLDITVSLVMQSVSSSFGEISRTEVDKMAVHADSFLTQWRLPPCVHFEKMPTDEKVRQCEDLIMHVKENRNAFFVCHNFGYNCAKKVNTFYVGMLSTSDLPASNKKADFLRKLFFPQITWVTDPAVVDKRHIPNTHTVLCPKYLPFLFTDFMRLKEGENVFMNYARIHVTYHPKPVRVRVDKLKRVLISDL